LKNGVALEGITKIVDDEPFLTDVRLSLPAGSFHVLLGRTRAGKTSLLRILAGLDRPTRGIVRFDGADVTRLDVRRRNVAMVYQQFVNYPSLTVYENIASPLRVGKKLSPTEIDRRVREAAAVLRLGGLLERLPAELSGGQQQRTAIARAIVKDADLLLLDEPLANLDYKLREELRSELRQIFQDRGGVVVYATAEPVEALLFGGQVAILDEGRLLQNGPALEVYAAPATERAGQIFSDPEMNVLDAEVNASGGIEFLGGLTIAPSGHLRNLAPGRARLGIRAHHVRLAPASNTDIRLPATVQLEEVNGSDTLLHARSGSTAILALVEGVHAHALGTALDLYLAPEKLFLWDSKGQLAACPPFTPGNGALHGHD
jgi:glycerol transport system ATP-binding protein